MIKAYICPNDREVLRIVKDKKIVRQGRTRGNKKQKGSNKTGASDIYVCPICKQHYVSFSDMKFLQVINIDNVIYKNLLKPTELRPYEEEAILRKTTSRSMVQPEIQPKAQPKIQPKIQSMIQPKAHSGIQPKNQSKNQTKIQPKSQPNIKPIVPPSQAKDTIKSGIKEANHFDQREIIPSHKKCLLYYGKNESVCDRCRTKLILKEYIIPTKERNIKCVGQYCPHCGIYYISYNTYIVQQQYWTVLNKDRIPDFEDMHRGKLDQKKIENRDADNKEKSDKKEKTDKKTKNSQYIPVSSKLQVDKELQNRLKNLYRNAPYQGLEVYQRVTQPQSVRLSNKSIQLDNSRFIQRHETMKSINNSERSITAKDFVVRSFVFKCRNNNHKIQDIQAAIITIGRNGTVTKTIVPAGYCPVCNTYFIMESVYKRIKDTGIPVCRTMDEKTYKNNNPSNGNKSSYDLLAQESVLKQFGYSVSQTDDLPAIQRRHILAAIVDYKVLSKSEIISYLEYFINSRKNQKNADGTQRYKIAISKWKEDIDFISHYRMGTFKTVEVARIITNR